MTETSINYAKALYELSVPEEAVLETEKIFRGTPQLKGALENPLVSLKEKEHVIDRVFPPVSYTHLTLPTTERV